MVDSNVEKPKHCIMFEIFNTDKDKDRDLPGFVGYYRVEPLCARCRRILTICVKPVLCMMDVWCARCILKTAHCLVFGKCM